MDDTVLNKSELVIDALQYAHDHNLDVHNKEDVQQILNALDPEHKENVDEFFDLLQTSDAFMSVEAQKTASKKPILPN